MACLTQPKLIVRIAALSLLPVAQVTPAGRPRAQHVLCSRCRRMTSTLLFNPTAPSGPGAIILRRAWRRHGHYPYAASGLSRASRSGARQSMVRIFPNSPSTPVYGLRSDRTLWQWGANQTRPVPVALAAALPSGATLSDLSFSNQHCLALYSDGSL
jgi:hypothetical protein